MINAYWEKSPFTLNLHEHQGNCKWCWKKSKRKLLTLAVDTPEVFEFPMRMEELYRFDRAKNTPDGIGRVFFRQNTSTKMLLEEAKQPFEKWHPAAVNFDLFDYEMDSAGGCSESCEVY